MADFKLSKPTRHIIENFAKIYNSIIFRPGHLITVVGKEQDVVAYAEVQDEFPERFAIGDLSKFLSVLSLYEEPTLTIKDGKILVIKGSGNRKFNYTLSAEKLIPTTEKTIDDFLTNFTNSTASFKLDASDLLAIKKNMSTAGLPYVSFAANKSAIVVQASNLTDTSDVFEMTLKTKSDANFNMIFSEYKINAMLEYNYDVSVYPQMVRFNTPWLGDKVKARLEYFNAPDRGSKVNG